jgi:hypothetical protein
MNIISADIVPNNMRQIHTQLITSCGMSCVVTAFFICCVCNNFEFGRWVLTFICCIPLGNRCYALSVSSVYMVLHSGIYSASRYPVIGSTLAAFWWRLCNCIVGMRTTQDILKGISSELFPHDPRRTCSNIPSFYLTWITPWHLLWCFCTCFEHWLRKGVKGRLILG